MGRPRRTSCRICGRSIAEVGWLSARGKCEDCGIGRLAVEIQQMRDHEGPFFEHWRRRHAASVGGVLVDDLADGD